MMPPWEAERFAAPTIGGILRISIGGLPMQAAMRAPPPQRPAAEVAGIGKTWILGGQRPEADRQVESEGLVPAVCVAVTALSSSTDEEEPPDMQVEMGDKEVCGICLENFAAGTELTALPCASTGCPSVWHSACIRQWLQQSHLISCPLCRADVGPPGSSPLPTPEPWLRLLETVALEHLHDVATAPEDGASPTSAMAPDGEQSLWAVPPPARPSATHMRALLLRSDAGGSPTIALVLLPEEPPFDGDGLLPATADIHRRPPALFDSPLSGLAAGRRPPALRPPIPPAAVQGEAAVPEGLLPGFALMFFGGPPAPLADPPPRRRRRPARGSTSPYTPGYAHAPGAGMFGYDSPSARPWQSWLPPSWTRRQREDLASAGADGLAGTERELWQRPISQDGISPWPPLPDMADDDVAAGFTALGAVPSGIRAVDWLSAPPRPSVAWAAPVGSSAGGAQMGGGTGYGYSGYGGGYGGYGGVYSGYGRGSRGDYRTSGGYGRAHQGSVAHGSDGAAAAAAAWLGDPPQRFSPPWRPPQQRSARPLTEGVERGRRRRLRWTPVDRGAAADEDRVPLEDPLWRMQPQEQRAAARHGAQGPPAQAEGIPPWRRWA